MLIPMLVVLGCALWAQRYQRGVADFLSAGRVGGRYVMSVASEMAGMGLITVVAATEAYYRSGLGYAFWEMLYLPVGFVLGLTGFCTYRFRETRAMTMGQFFEMRFSRSFRVTAAVIQSVSGIINYAIFPAVGARFLIYYLDLPGYVELGGWALPSFQLVMALFLGAALLITLLGGQVTVLVTDCVQGLFSYPMYLLILAFILWRFDWGTQVMPVLSSGEPGHSLLNPFEIENLRDFNAFYVFVGITGMFLGRLSWGGTQGFNSSARSAHEARMGNLLGTWRAQFYKWMSVILAIAALTYLHGRDFADEAHELRRELASRVAHDVAPAHAGELCARFAALAPAAEAGDGGLSEAPATAAPTAAKGAASTASTASSASSASSVAPVAQVATAASPAELTAASAPAVLVSEGLAAAEAGAAPDGGTASVGKADVKGPGNGAGGVQAGRRLGEDPFLRTAKSVLSVPVNGADGASDARLLTDEGRSFATIYSQMTVSVALKHMLPEGLIGIFCALMIFLLISTDTSYLHSWGSILVQDFVLPLCRKPLTPHQQLLALRLAIAGVAAFAFIFSSTFAQVDFILMFFAITGAFWAGAGAVITLGLYWSRGTTQGAFAALIAGALIALSGFAGQKFWPEIYGALASLGWVEPVGSFLDAVTSWCSPYIVWRMNPEKFPVNSQEILFITNALSLLVFVLVSLKTCRRPFNMDRLLHRGAWSIEGEEAAAAGASRAAEGSPSAGVAPQAGGEATSFSKSGSALQSEVGRGHDDGDGNSSGGDVGAARGRFGRFLRERVLGIDEHFSRGDRLIAWAAFLWSFGYVFLICLVGVVVWNLIAPWPEEWWGLYFYVTIFLGTALLGLVFSVWFTWGGIRDLRALFRDLRLRADRSELDNGSVIGHVSAADCLRFAERSGEHPSTARREGSGSAAGDEGAPTAASGRAQRKS